MVTKHNYPQQKERLKWCKAMANKFKTHVYDDDIAWLTMELTLWENTKSNLVQNLVLEIKSYLEKTGMQQKDLAGAMGFSKSEFSMILNEKRIITDKIRSKIIQFNFNSLNVKI